MYVAAAYDSGWFTGSIVASNGEECDILVRVMERKV
jgi:hypothetical protein